MEAVPVAWDAAFEARCRALVDAVLEQRGAARLLPWQDLLALVGPHLERWAARHPVLRALRLTSEDEARAVLVRVVERLQRDGYRNLRAFVAARGAGPPPDPAGADEAVVKRFAQVASLVDDAEPARDALEDTPLRAWLKGLSDFAARDHAAARLGRRAALATPSDTGPADKRRVNSNAERFEEGQGGSLRPPITDLLTLKRIVVEVTEFMNRHLPDLQRQALLLRLDDGSYGEIARELELRDPAEAEALVRAAKHRLRTEFRAQRARFGIEDDGAPADS